MHQAATADEQIESTDRLIGELEQLRRGLLRSHRLATLGTLAAAVAHEFNNILTPIVTYCDMALAPDADPKLANKALNFARDGANRATQIGKSILGYCRDSDGHDAAELSACIDPVIQSMGPMVDKGGVRLRNHVPEGLRVKVNPIYLQQVLMNLILNAVRAMKGDGGGVLEIRAYRGDDPDTICLEVCDTGPGIPPEVIDHLWEPFTRSEPDDPSLSSEGSGLGMAICHHLVKRAGGTIEVMRSDPSGTAIGLRLPG